MKLKSITRTAVLGLGVPALIAVSGCQAAQTPGNVQDPSQIQTGLEIVQTHCVACHTAATTGTSPRADAPPLRTVLSTYSPDALADDFREHIHVGHPDMPDFDFSVREIDGLLAYLRSIQETP